MDPTFQRIADLFEVEIPIDVMDVEEVTRPLKGKNSEESRVLGGIRLNEGDYEAAIRHFQAAIDQKGGMDPELATELGAAFEYADQAPQAFRQYTQAVKANDNAGDAQIGLSDIYKRLGRVSESLDRIEKLIEAEPNNPQYLIKFAETLREVGYPKRALTYAQRAVVLRPDDAFFHFWIADLCLELGRNQEAVRSIRAAIELSPGDDYIYVLAATAFWKVDRRQEAVKSIRLASDLDPSKNLYHGILEVLLDEMGLQVEADLESGRADQMDAFDQENLRRILLRMGIQ